MLHTQTPTTHVRRPPSTLHSFKSQGGHGMPSIELPQLKTPAITTPTEKSPPPRRLSLPAELHLEIIDVIAHRVSPSPCQDKPCDLEDLNTLRACALVCKLWLNTARIGIWKGVRLSCRKRSMALIRLLHAYEREPGNTLPTWTIPSFGRFVTQLSVRETRGNAWDPTWLDDALPDLATHLSRVQSLEMERITWAYLSSQSRAACLQAFKGAKQLALRGFVFHTTQDMCNFLGEFSELEELTLDGVHCAKKSTLQWCFGSVVDGKRCMKLPPRGLKEVGFRDVPMEAVLGWIMAGSSYQREEKPGPGIRSVRMGGVGVSEANIVGKFLRGIGHSLRKVHIGFESDFMDRGDLLVEELELAENTNLEEFHIFGLVVPSPPPTGPFEDEAPPQRALEALTSLLSQIRSRMRVLSLALYPADLRAMSVVDFEGLGKVFEKCVWSYLDEVRVVISNKGDYGMGKVVKERLKVLHERGVLQVNIGFDEREVL